MAGVNLSEENACILATNSELVGTLVQSCKDEPFLFIGPLQKRILDIGKYDYWPDRTVSYKENVIKRDSLGWFFWEFWGLKEALEVIKISWVL